MRFFLAFLILIFLTSSVKAKEIYENWVSARAAGMGNAYSALVNNSDALFYNPAGLDRVHGLHLTAVGFNAGTDAQNAYSTLQSATGSGYSSLLHQFFGQEVWANVSDQLTLAMHDLAFSAYDNFNLSFDLHNPAYPNLNMRVTNDIGISIGAAASLLPNDAWRLGVAFKRISRYGGQTPFGPSTIATLSNSQMTAMMSNYGVGYGADIGTMIELPGPSHATFSGVWQDVGQTKFTPLSGTPPPAQDNNMIVGFGMDISATLFHIRPAFEARHLNMDSEQLGKRLNMGVELAFPGFSIRAGANQGYYTAGAGIDLDWVRVDAATYGVELDDYPGQREDRRYMVQATIDLNFDISFGGDGKDGGKSNGSGVSRSYYRR